MARKTKKDNYESFVGSVERQKRLRTKISVKTSEKGLFNYVYDGLYKKICCTPAQDAIRNGYEICDSNENIVVDDETKKINDILFDFDIDNKMTNAVSLARATGGAVLLLLVDDGESIENELDYNNLKRIYGVKVYDATEVFPRTINMDYSSYDFGSIITYNVIDSRTGKNFIVHSSRLIVFDGMETVDRVRSQRNGWGGMVLDECETEIERYNQASKLSISILSRISQGVLKIKNLMGAINAGKEDKIKKYVSEMDALRSVMNSLIIDSEDDFDLKNMTLTGYKDIIEQQQIAVSAVAKIPVTILFGRSPAGMNSTGESDMETYYAMLKRIQNTFLIKGFDKILKIIMNCSEYGIDNDDLYHIKFNELKIISEKDKAEIKNKDADTISKIANAFTSLHELGVVDNDEISEFLDKKTDVIINHAYGKGE